MQLVVKSLRGIFEQPELAKP